MKRMKKIAITSCFLIFALANVSCKKQAVSAGDKTVESENASNETDEEALLKEKRKKAMDAIREKESEKMNSMVEESNKNFDAALALAEGILNKDGLKSTVSVTYVTGGFTIANSGSYLNNVKLRINSAYVYDVGILAPGVFTYKYTQFNDLFGNSFADSKENVKTISLEAKEGTVSW